MLLFLPAMKAKEAVLKLEVEGITVEKKIEILGKLFEEEARWKLNQRYGPHSFIDQKKIEQLKREMREWLNTVKRVGKYDWIDEKAGEKLFQDLLFEVQKEKGGYKAVSFREIFLYVLIAALLVLAVLGRVPWDVFLQVVGIAFLGAGAVVGGMKAYRSLFWSKRRR